jgi:hypothetical protein
VGEVSALVSVSAVALAVIDQNQSTQYLAYHRRI